MERSAACWYLCAVPPVEEPRRIRTGWSAIRMARELERKFLTPLAELLPPAHEGELGDAARVACMTCHLGQKKPPAGVSMIADYSARAASRHRSPALQRYSERPQ